MLYDFTDKPVTLRYRRRAEANGVTDTPDWEREMSTPTLGESVQLQGGSDGVIPYRNLLRTLGQRNEDRARRMAITAVNDLSQRFGDLICGHPTVQLSDEGTFPAYDQQALPTAVQITYGREQIVDTRWTALFNVQDRRDQRNRQFTVNDVYTAAAIQQYDAGEEIEIRNVYGGSETFEFNIYAGGIQWERFWEGWQDMWREDDGTAMMQARWGQHQANRAYTVLTASGISTQSYENFDGSGSTSVANDVATFNAAATQILQDMYENQTMQDGQDVGENVREEFQNPEFYIVVNQWENTLKTRISRAMATQFDAPNDNLSTNELQYPTQMIDTPHVPTGTWYMVFPGRKNVAAINRDLTMFDRTDITKAGVAEMNVAQGAYRMVRADSNQVREMATS